MYVRWRERMMMVFVPSRSAGGFGGGSGNEKNPICLTYDNEIAVPSGSMASGPPPSRKGRKNNKKNKKKGVVSACASCRAESRLAIAFSFWPEPDLPNMVVGSRTPSPQRRDESIIALPAASSDNQAELQRAGQTGTTPGQMHA
jgi:hypothetical protein